MALSTMKKTIIKCAVLITIPSVIIGLYLNFWAAYWFIVAVGIVWCFLLIVFWVIKGIGTFLSW